jgi:hypothetical protein
MKRQTQFRKYCDATVSKTTIQKRTLTIASLHQLDVQNNESTHVTHVVATISRCDLYTTMKKNILIQPMQQQPTVPRGHMCKTTLAVRQARQPFLTSLV